MFIDLSKVLLWCMHLSLLELIYQLNFIPIRKEWAGNIRQITLSHNLDKYLQIWHDLGQKWIIYKVNNADKTAPNWSSIIRMHTASPCGFWDVVCKTTRNVQRTISRVTLGWMFLRIIIPAENLHLKWIFMNLKTLKSGQYIFQTSYFSGICRRDINLSHFCSWQWNDFLGGKRNGFVICGGIKSRRTWKRNSFV